MLCPATNRQKVKMTLKDSLRCPLLNPFASRNGIAIRACFGSYKRPQRVRMLQPGFFDRFQHLK